MVGVNVAVASAVHEWVRRDNDRVAETSTVAFVKLRVDVGLDDVMVFQDNDLSVGETSKV